MNKKNRSTDVFPKNFDINKYENMDKLSAYEWFFLIQKRIMLHLAVENGLDFGFTNEELTQVEKNEIIFLAIQNNFDNPLMLDLRVDFKKNDGKEINVEISTCSVDSFMRSHLPVNELNMDKLKMLFKLIKYKGVDLNSFNSENDLESVVDVLNPKKYSNISLSEYPIIINPYYPDKVIISELIEILSVIRSKIGTRGSYKKALKRKDLLNWASYRLLAYFDLKIFELQEGLNITNAVYSSALFPKGEYGEENIRKSIEPIRQKILDPNCFDGQCENMELNLMDALSYLAYCDLTKSGKKYNH